MSRHSLEMRLLHLNSERAIAIAPHECAAIKAKLKTLFDDAREAGFGGVAANVLRLIRETN